MKYTEVKPCVALENHIHSFWELQGEENDCNWERIFPDGCPGVIINLGEPCQTDNGLVAMDYGKTYLAGAMTSFKDSFVDPHTHLLGVCFKAAAFSSFYRYAPLNELTNATVEFDLSLSFEIEKLTINPNAYLNRYFLDKAGNKELKLQSVLNDIHSSKGNVSIYEIARRNFTTIRQLERNFKVHIGLTPKEYANIIRFQNAVSMINNSNALIKTADIAFECGFYDHAHLTNEIKRHTGLTPSQF